MISHCSDVCPNILISFYTLSHICIRISEEMMKRTSECGMKALCNESCAENEMVILNIVRFSIKFRIKNFHMSSIADLTSYSYFHYHPFLLLFPFSIHHTFFATLASCYNIGNSTRHQSKIYYSIYLYFNTLVFHSFPLSLFLSLSQPIFLYIYDLLHVFL